jgi:hypothetical protein
LTAPTIYANEPGSFPYSVFMQRHPALIDATRHAYDYPQVILAALDDLATEVTTGQVRGLPGDAVDAEDWNDRWNHGYFGHPWTDLPWLWGESYFYRRLLDAVGYFHPGPWQHVDPFAPVKRTELAATAVDDELASFDELADRPAAERFAALVQAALWGNRADLGFNLSKPDAAGRSAVSSLVVDDTQTFWEYAYRNAPLSIGLIADNAGRELIPDLMLIDLLLATDLATAVTLHVKPYPYFVSDATTTDVDAALDRMYAGPASASAAAARLRDAIRGGRLTVTAARLFCAPLPYRDEPAEMRRLVGGCDLTILKGDLNYRRLVGDQLWPPTTPFAGPAGYFPGPLVALRTLKSDVVVGLGAEQVAALDASGDDWRKSGRYAMVQARL